MVKTTQTEKIRKMVLLTMLSAIVLVLQLTGFAIRIPVLGTPVSLVLIPITLGAMLLGPAAGAWLGFLFGAEVYLVCGVMGTDPFTNFLFLDHPFATAAICLVKSTLAGWVSGLIYQTLSKRKKTVSALLLASAITPVINTGVFILGCLLIRDTLAGYMTSNGIAGSVIYFLIIGCAGINFLFEFAFSMILAPSLQRLLVVFGRKKIEE